MMDESIEHGDNRSDTDTLKQKGLTEQKGSLPRYSRRDLLRLLGAGGASGLVTYLLTACGISPGSPEEYNLSEFDQEVMDAWSKYSQKLAIGSIRPAVQMIEPGPKTNQESLEQILPVGVLREENKPPVVQLHSNTETNSKDPRSKDLRWLSLLYGFTEALAGPSTSQDLYFNTLTIHPTRGFEAELAREGQVFPYMTGLQKMFQAYLAVEVGRVNEHIPDSWKENTALQKVLNAHEIFDHLMTVSNIKKENEDIDPKNLQEIFGFMKNGQLGLFMEKLKENVGSTLTSDSMALLTLEIFSLAVSDKGLDDLTVKEVKQQLDQIFRPGRERQA